jgi:hypothetical protein
MGILRRLFICGGVASLVLSGHTFGTAGATTSVFDVQSHPVYQGSGWGNETSLTGSNFPTSFDWPTKTSQVPIVAFSAPGIEGYVYNGSFNGITGPGTGGGGSDHMAIQIEVAPWAPLGPSDVTITGADGSVQTCSGCVDVVGSSPGVAVSSVAPSKLTVGRYGILTVHGSGFVPGSKVIPEGAVGQFAVNATTYVDSTTLTVPVSGGAGGNGMQNDPYLLAVIVQNPDGNVAICSDCMAISSSAPVTRAMSHTHRTRAHRSSRSISIRKKNGNDM